MFSTNELIILSLFGLYITFYVLFVKKKMGKKILLVLLGLSCFIFLGQVSLNPEVSYKIGNFHHFNASVERLHKFDNYQLIIEKTTNKKDETITYKPYLYYDLSNIYFKSGNLKEVVLVNYEDETHLKVYLIKGKTETMVLFKEGGLDFTGSSITDFTDHVTYSYLVFENLEEGLPSLVINGKPHQFIE